MMLFRMFLALFCIAMFGALLFCGLLGLFPNWDTGSVSLFMAPITFILGTYYGSGGTAEPEYDQEESSSPDGTAIGESGSSDAPSDVV